MGLAFADVNGQRTSYCSIELGIEALRVVGVKSINYRETHDIGKIRGTSPKPIGRTRGIVDFEGDMEFYEKDWVQLVLPVISRLGAFGFAELAFPVSVTYAEMINPLDTVTDRLLGVRFHSPDRSGASDSPDAMTVKVTLSIMDIIWANRYQGLRSIR